MCKSVLTLQGIGVDLKNLSALYVIISAMIIIAFLISKAKLTLSRSVKEYFLIMIFVVIFFHIQGKCGSFSYTFCG